MLLYAGIQIFTAAAWDPPYRWLDHTVSELGYVSCGVQDRASGALETCSPRHLAYNAVGVAVMLLILAGALLQRRAWSGRLGRWIDVLFVVLTLCGIGTAVVPGDVDLAVHSVLGFALVLGQIVVLLLVRAALRDRRRPLSIAALVIALVSIGGVALFLVATLAGGLPMGLTERIGAEPYYAWLALAAVLGCEPPRDRALAGGSAPSSRQVSPPRRPR